MPRKYTRRPLAERFWEKVEKTDTCWMWTHSCQRSGYGRFFHQRRHCSAHRIAYELTYGPIPPGKQVLHSCDTPRCCNPSHLRLGTHMDNMADKVTRGRQMAGSMNGERHPRAKYTDEQIRMLRARHNDGSISIPQLAKDFGIPRYEVWRIVHGKRWQHVK